MSEKISETLVEELISGLSDVTSVTSGRSLVKYSPSAVHSEKIDKTRRPYSPNQVITSRVVRFALVRWIAGIGFVAGCDPAAAADRVDSRYTSTARSKALSFKDESEIPEGGFEAVFAGLGGYKLVHLSGDERSWINIRFGKETVDLYAATMHAGGGTFPHKANDIVEWRGTENNGRFVPHAIIYRLAAGNDETRKIHTRLVVIRLDKERSAVIGHAEGPNEEADARAIADKAR